MCCGVYYSVAACVGRRLAVSISSLSSLVDSRGASGPLLLVDSRAFGPVLHVVNVEYHVHSI